MTNIFAIVVPIKEPEYIFCIADSQSTSNSDGTKESRAQKMVQRGNNILMDTGSATIAYEVYDKIKNADVSAPELAQTILKETEEIAKKFDGSKIPTTIHVSGKEKDKLCMLEVELYNTKSEYGSTTRGITPSQNMYSNGVGRRHVAPAINRDFEQGYFVYPKTPLEALILCFGVGAKADTDLGVNEKLQLGIVGKSTTRLLLPTGVRGYNMDEHRKYYSNITGIPFDADENAPDAVHEKYFKIVQCMWTFYDAFQTVMKELVALDTQTNYRHSRFKIGEVQLSNYLDFVKKREETGKEAQLFIDALMKGGIREFNIATRQFYERQKDLMKEVDDIATPKSP